MGLNHVGLVLDTGSKLALSDGPSLSSSISVNLLTLWAWRVLRLLNIKAFLTDQLVSFLQDFCWLHSSSISMQSVPTEESGKGWKRRARAGQVCSGGDKLLVPLSGKRGLVSSSEPVASSSKRPKSSRLGKKVSSISSVLAEAVEQPRQSP
ncbi:hypothetical protein SLA2020_365100 [Shorea laevis]